MLFFKITTRLKVEGLENVPKSGGALMVSNHLHNVDPVLLEAVFPRPVRFMAKKEVFSIPFAEWVARMTDSFAVDRGNPDRAALRHAQTRLLGGVIVGMFPEGTRSTTGGLKDVFPGAAAIALRANVPVIPTAIIGTDTLPGNGSKPRRPGPRRVTVRIGKPFYLHRETEDGSRPDLAEITDQMMIEVARLLPENYRGIYADRVRESVQETVEEVSTPV
ncbi:MAG: 1-acyl-sn-glycerol-3-phosphate acyltransferase [Sphaerobacteraceae bacterium]|nr:MAG: 1-acyl-sn-glycerol-3-phosphate acyltransferase [Sphaerobacteraceae bacterium]